MGADAPEVCQDTKFGKTLEEEDVREEYAAQQDKLPLFLQLQTHLQFRVVGADILQVSTAAIRQ
jgi:hypothetical protein